ncbi:MAG: lipopolysaccharide kinase InaA family protein [Phycisphaerae bacterium]|jgi:tRNA A-37 threonylcarbamoyl transferase component Bud32
MSERNDPLDEALAAAGLNSLEGAFAYGGGQDLVKPSLGNRRRTRIELTDRTGRRHVLYLKRYAPESFFSRLRRGWTYGFAAGPARVEYDNIQRAAAAGVPTMQVVRWEEHCGWLGVRPGYLIAAAVPGDALERCAAAYLSRGGPQAGATLAAKLAKLAATLHAAGYVHRDLYAGHIFLQEQEQEQEPAGSVELYLIDLARMFAPRWRRFRWQVKDLAQLKFSMPAEWVRRHWADFMRQYLAARGRSDAARYNRCVDRKAAAITRRHARKHASPGNRTA